jgi:hypothetical protein
VDKDSIPVLTVGNDLHVGSNHVLTGGSRVLAVVHEDNDVLLLEAVHIDDIFLHVEYIIVAATQDARGVTDVVDATEMRVIEMCSE